MKYKTIITEEQIKQKVREIAEQIARDYSEVYLVTVLEGAKYFASDLIKELVLLGVVCTNNYVKLSSYGDATQSSGIVKVVKDVDNVNGKNVLIVEDIVDTGNSMHFLINHLKEKGAKSVRVCTFLNKPSRRVKDVKIDYFGFIAEDKFMIGYGLDYAQKYRELPFIAEVVEK